MRVVIVGLGVQGKKRQALLGKDVVATVDLHVPEAFYRTIEEVPSASYDAAFVCTPDHTKLGIISYLIQQKKHILVEKPLLVGSPTNIDNIAQMAQANGVVCYTAYNHRFEPHIARLHALLEEQTIGTTYTVRVFYGNGTARDVRNSPWRDQGLGVLADLGSHLLDMVLFLFGDIEVPFRLWRFDCFENRACDHVIFASEGTPFIEVEASLLAWRNEFRIDVFGELGSIHLDGLCKWGPSQLVVRKRVFPSGRPVEEEYTLRQPDPTWELEHAFFEGLCLRAGTNIGNDMWISGILSDLAKQAGCSL